MPLLSEVRDLVLRDWPADSTTVQLFDAIIREFRPEAVQALHLGDIQAILPNKTPLRAIIESVEYLSSEHLGLMLARFVLQREDESVVDLDPDVVREAFETGTLYDPASGGDVEDWKEHLVPTYSGTERLEQLLREEHGE